MKSPNDTLTRKFRKLQSLLEQEGRFVLIEDLMGISGALFRIYWPAEEIRPGGSARHPASVCSGDPIARAAHAFQYSVRTVPAGDDWELSISRIREIATLKDRIDFFVASLGEGCRLHREGEYFESGLYLSGGAAYDGMIQCVEEAGQTAGEERRSPDDLPAVLTAIGECRGMLGHYLDRLGNFLDTGPALHPFEQEGKALLEASSEYEREDDLNGKNRKNIARLLRRARKHYTRGFRVIRSLLKK